MSRTAFFISDRTGVTAEMLGSSLLTQFDGLVLRRETLPFIDTEDKVQRAVARISRVAQEDNARPLVFSTIVQDRIRALLAIPNAYIIDLFGSFIAPLEVELGQTSSHTIGRSHGVPNSQDYNARIYAVNYALAHDDGIKPSGLAEADVILIGVSRCGKTPTCLYLALQYSLKAANYPLTPEDLQYYGLPKTVAAHQHKLFGLSIVPERLAQIRAERRADSHYAAVDNCRWEVAAAEALFREFSIPYLDSTVKSIEELASTILYNFNVPRHRY